MVAPPTHDAIHSVMMARVPVRLPPTKYWVMSFCLRLARQPIPTSMPKYASSTA